MSNATASPIDHPGTFIQEELEHRGWAQADLAYILGMDGGQLNKLIQGTTNVTPNTAVALADALDMPAEFFLDLQKMFDLHKAQKADPGVKARASWVSVFPVREMIKRGWIEDAEPALLNLQMMRFFEMSHIEDIPFISDAKVMAHAARKAAYDETTAIQYAWLHRVRKVAASFECTPYSESDLRASLPIIRAHMLDKDDIAVIPSILKKCGVRLVLVEHLPGSKIDGVCVWVNGQPVIGMTLRYDRLDNFCFVLRHEIEHVLRGDGKEEMYTRVDEFGSDYELTDSLVDCEKIANSVAGEFCIPHELFESFFLRKSPYISENDVLAFSARVKINPAVVVGQIQNRTKKFGWLRKYQTSSRDCLLGWQHKDGWGFFAPAML